MHAPGAGREPAGIFFAPEPQPILYVAWAVTWTLLMLGAAAYAYDDLLLLTDDPAEVVDFVIRTPPRVRVVSAATSVRRGGQARSRRILPRR